MKIVLISSLYVQCETDGSSLPLPSSRRRSLQRGLSLAGPSVSSLFATKAAIAPSGRQLAKLPIHRNPLKHPIYCPDQPSKPEKTPIWRCQPVQRGSLQTQNPIRVSRSHRFTCRPFLAACADDPSRVVLAPSPLPPGLTSQSGLVTVPPLQGTDFVARRYPIRLFFDF